MSTPDDLALMALIDRIAQQDDKALAALYALTSGKLFGLALKVVRRHDWAEDALQDAFLHIWRTAPAYRATLSPPMAWLALVVRSRALDVWRRQQAQRAQLTDELQEDWGDHVQAEETPMSLHMASQHAQALHACLSKLEKAQRQAVSLSYLRDMSHTELAQHLNAPLGTVKSWVRRGLEQLRGCLQKAHVQGGVA